MNRRQFLKVSAVAAAGVLSGFPRIDASVPTADLILSNGKIITVDPNDSIAEGIAVRGGRIIACGAGDLIAKYRGNDTQFIDLAGRTLTPGLIDSHAHLPMFGLRENGWFLKLHGIDSKEELLGRIAERARRTPKGEWVSCWGVESLDINYLRRTDLDRVSTDHPILVVHSSGQWGTANSRALKVARIDGSTPDPYGSRLLKDESTGEPTGVLIHYPALQLVRMHMPVPKEEESREALLHAARLYLAEGVTTVHDNFFSLSDRFFVKPYLDLIYGGTMPVGIRIWTYMGNREMTERFHRAVFDDPLDGRSRNHHVFGQIVRRKLEHPDLFRSIWGGFKFAVDGGGRTGLWYMFQRRLPMHSKEEFNRMIGFIHRHGHQVSVHAVGDMGVDWTLDAIETASKGDSGNPLRHRIEHANCPRFTSVERMKRLGVVVSTHPQWIHDWMGKSSLLRMEGDIQAVMPLKTYLDTGVPVAFGADPPAHDDYRPQTALWQAGARESKQGARFSPSQSISIRQALRCQTMGSAYAGSQEKEIGSLETGKWADMVVWDRDFYTVPQEEIRNARALCTIRRGRIVYEKNIGYGSCSGGAPSKDYNYNETRRFL